MRELFVGGETLPVAYHKALLALRKVGKIVPCPDYNTEQVEASMTMIVSSPTAEPRISRLFIGGFRELEQYREEMLDGILDFEIDRGNWKYTYHDRMTNWMGDHTVVNQVEFVIDELRRNPYSRRAVIDVRNNGEDAYADDPACLQHIQYFIREDKLACCVLFRSNDACKAAFMNAYALICLQEWIAKELGVEVGTYTHRANSFHCYARDYDLLDGYVNRIESGEDLTYNYKGEWDELMEEAKAEIKESVERLRNV